MSLPDIIITHKGEGTNFSAQTPKGEEWLQLYVLHNNTKLTHKERWVFKHHMAQMGLLVEDLIG